MGNAPEKGAPAWWEPVWELVVHVMVGSLLFAIIFTPAIALDLAVKWLENSLEVSEFLATLLTWTKYLIAVLDVFLYVVFMVRMAWLFVARLWLGGPPHDRNKAIP